MDAVDLLQTDRAFFAALEFRPGPEREVRDLLQVGRGLQAVLRRIGLGHRDRVGVEEWGHVAHRLAALGVEGLGQVVFLLRRGGGGFDPGHRGHRLAGVFGVGVDLPAGERLVHDFCGPDVGLVDDLVALGLQGQLVQRADDELLGEVLGAEGDRLAVPHVRRTRGTAAAAAGAARAAATAAARGQQQGDGGQHGERRGAR